MQLATYFGATIIYSAFSIIAVGLSAAVLMSRLAGARFAVGGAFVLTVCAIGIYWNAVVFIGLFLIGKKVTWYVLLAKLTLEAILMVLAILLTRREIPEVVRRSFEDPVVLAFFAIGSLGGCWAMLQFPHVLDSSQIQWTQLALSQTMSLSLPAMLGYSGLVPYPAVLFPDAPVVTTAAAFKPLLVALFACLALMLADVLAPRHRVFYALGFALLSIVTTFGLYGLLNLGKDSIWGLIFGMAFLATLCRERPSEHSVEMGIYFAVATTTGIIALPYMLTAYLLWLCFSAPEDKAADTIPMMLLINAPVFPPALAGFLKGGLVSCFIGYAAASLVIIGLMRIGSVRQVAATVVAPLRLIRAWLPMLLLVPCWALFPVALHFPVWFNADGSVVKETRHPLDGVTTFFGYLSSNPLQDRTFWLGLAGAAVVGFTRFGRERAGLSALAAMPLAVLLLALVRAHSGIPIVSDFNVWDLVKDIPQWLGGTLYVFLLFAALRSVFEGLRPVAFLAPVIATSTCFAWAWPKVPGGMFTARVTYNTYSGSVNASMAVAASLVWEHLRWKIIYMDPELDISRRYFYSFQMYGGRPSRFELEKLATQIVSGGGVNGFIVKNGDIAVLEKAAIDRGGQMTHLASLDDGKASLVKVVIDRK
jgi:hypothetical protein